MNNHFKIRSLRVAILTLAFLSCTYSVRAQDRTLSESEVTDLVVKSLPTWDKSVLAVDDGPDWSAGLDFDAVLKALGEDALRAPASSGDRRVVDGSRVLRLTQELGRVRFVERARTWDPSQTATKPVDSQTAINFAFTLLGRLGVPRAELAAPRADVQLGLDEDMRTPSDSQVYAKYSLVSVHRNVGRLEVYGSRARLAITNTGALQRLRLSWPAFRLARNLTLRQRDAIVKDAVTTIVRQNAAPLTDATSFIKTRLAYVPETATLPYVPHGSQDETPSTSQDTRPDADDDLTKLGPEQFTFPKTVDPVHYIPALVIAVSAAPTPYELLIPIAE